MRNFAVYGKGEISDIRTRFTDTRKSYPLSETAVVENKGVPGRAAGRTLNLGDCEQEKITIPHASDRGIDFFRMYMPGLLGRIGKKP